MTTTNKPKDRIASDFLSYLHERVPSFVTTIVAKLKTSEYYDIDVTNLQADHVCYRTESIQQYTELVKALQCSEASDSFILLVESEIGGRPISTFKLLQPIEIDSGNSLHRIDVVEIPSPKEGSPYDAGLEHIEFVIGDGKHNSPINDEVHATALDAWMRRYPCVAWNTKACHKECNPDVSFKMELCDYGKVSVKFHLMPLEAVIKFETGAI
ncbi:hypothetical protein ACHAWT_009974 [Skeletonema menzelii]